MKAWRVKFPIVHNHNLTEKIGCCGDKFLISGDRGGANFSELEANRLAKKIKPLLLNKSLQIVWFPLYQKDSLCILLMLITP